MAGALATAGRSHAGIGFAAMMHSADRTLPCLAAAAALLGAYPCAFTVTRLEVSACAGHVMALAFCMQHAHLWLLGPLQPRKSLSSWCAVLGAPSSATHQRTGGALLLNAYSHQ